MYYGLEKKMTDHKIWLAEHKRWAAVSHALSILAKLD